MTKEKLEGNNEILAFGISAAKKETSRLNPYEKIGACRPLTLRFKRETELAIKANDL